MKQKRIVLFVPGLFCLCPDCFVCARNCFVCARIVLFVPGSFCLCPDCFVCARNTFFSATLLSRFALFLFHGMPRVHGIKTVFVYARIVLIVPVIHPWHICQGCMVSGEFSFMPGLFCLCP
jgi:hypothetical protein